MAVEQRGMGVGVVSGLALLRRRTRAAHGRLDVALTGPDGAVRDPERYVRLLATLSLLHARTDEPLLSWVRSRSWVRRHVEPALLPRRGPLYAADLAALGRADRTSPPQTTVCQDAQGLGYLYVVAGSSAGARLVRRGLPDELAPQARSGLDDAAARGPRLWGACRRLLSDPLPEALVGRAADEAAELFGLLLRELPSDPVRNGG